MAIEKFRFVSPGVQINEIDDSIVTPLPPAIGPVVIGRTAKGPAMQPVRVSSVAELERVFGSPSNGNVGATDVWRSDVPTAPTFGTYAARAFLRNSNPVTVIRLAGVETPVGESGNPGWTVNKAYHLYALNGTTAKLAAVFYAPSTTTLQISNSLGGFSSANSGSTFSSGVGNLYLTTSAGNSVVPFSFDKNAVSFLRNAFNTNPTLYSSEGYFLGETFENSLQTSITGYYLTSSNSTSFASSSISAESGYVTSDHASGADPENLFKFVGLNSGGTLSKEIKISIQNVRPSRNLTVTKYGTFDVVVYRLFESQTQSVLERFNGVTLDTNSGDYIARRIGDSFRAWDAVNNRYVEYGTFPNNSVYVRVVMSEGDIAPTALPHGFRIIGRPTVANSNFLTGTNGTIFSASHPDITMLTGSYKTSVSKTTRLGFSTNSVTNVDLIDILRQKPLVSQNADTLFSTRYVSSSATEVYYSGSAYYNSAADVLVSGTILGFDLPLYGGFDGVDITKKEPIVNQYLLNGTSETTSAGYRSIYQALNLVADPETLDMNVLCVPNLKEKGLTQKMIDVCRARGDAMAIIDLEGDYQFPFESADQKTESRPIAVTTTVNNLEARAIDDSYGAAYFPAVFVPTEAIFMPASIAALGAFGGTEGRSALWFAPAGFNRGGLTEGTAGIGVSRTVLTLNSSDRDSLQIANINPIATFPNEGVVIFGQKTLQVTPSALDRVNVRRLVNFIKKEISRAATRVLFEPNVEATWNSFKNVVDPFLLAIQNGFGLEDARVVLDSSTTTADLVDRNIMYAKIFIKPTRAIEYIAIDFVVTNSGAAFTE